MLCRNGEYYANHFDLPSGDCLTNGDRPADQISVTDVSIIDGDLSIIECPGRCSNSGGICNLAVTAIGAGGQGTRAYCYLLHLR